MAIPENITEVRVFGSYVGADGTALRGTVSFTPSALSATEGASLPVTPTRVCLDDDGAFSVDLAATDDTDWEPGEFVYLVTESITGSRPYKREFYIEVPAASVGGELDLALAPAVSAPEPAVLLTAQNVRDYAVELSHEDEVIQDAIDAETEAQARICRIADPMPADLLQALKRRVLRNLSLRNQPALVTSPDESPSFLPSWDPEVRRLEKPYRKVLVG